jgi:hypothetical protein
MASITSGNATQTQSSNGQSYRGSFAIMTTLFGHSHKLGTRVDTAKPTILAKYPSNIARLSFRFSLPRLVIETANA